MYTNFFRLSQKPFSIAPDPSFLYLSDRHREALAHLMYGLQTEGGFVLITGEVGTGKTTLIRSLIERVPDALNVAFVLNPRLTVKELLETLPTRHAVTALSLHRGAPVLAACDAGGALRVLRIGHHGESPAP